MENSTMQRGPEQWFLDAHPERGSVRVQVSTGRGLFPVEGARVEIYRRLGTEPTVFYEGVTDAGISGTVYQVSVRHPQHGTVEGRPVTVFPRIETVLAVSLGAA